MSQTTRQVKCKWCGWVGEEHHEPVVCRQVEREASKELKEWKVEQKAERKRSKTVHGGAESVPLLDAKEKARQAADYEWLRQRVEGAKLLTGGLPPPEVVKEMAETRVEYEWNKDWDDALKEEWEEKKKKMREADFTDLEKALREEWEAKKTKEAEERWGYDDGQTVEGTVMDANPGAQIVLGEGVRVMSLQQVDAQLKEMTAPPEGTVDVVGYEVVDGPVSKAGEDVVDGPAPKVVGEEECVPPPPPFDDAADSSGSEVDRDCPTPPDEVADATDGADTTDGPGSQTVDDLNDPNQHFYAHFWGCWDPEIKLDLCAWMNYVEPDTDDYFSEGEEANGEAAVFCKKSERVYEEMQARLLDPKRVAAEKEYAERDPLVRIEDHFFVFHWGSVDSDPKYKYVSCVKWPCTPLPEFPPFWKGITPLAEFPYYEVERRRLPLLIRRRSYANPEVEALLDFMVLSVVGGVMAEWMLKGREAGRYYFPWKEWEALYRHIVNHGVEKSVIYACEVAMNALLVQDFKNKWELYVIRKMMKLCSGDLLAEFLARRHHLADLGLLTLHGPYAVAMKECHPATGTGVHPSATLSHYSQAQTTAEALTHGDDPQAQGAAEALVPHPDTQEETLRVSARAPRRLQPTSGDTPTSQDPKGEEEARARCTAAPVKTKHQ